MCLFSGVVYRRNDFLCSLVKKNALMRARGTTKTDQRQKQHPLLYKGDSPRIFLFASTHRYITYVFICVYFHCSVTLSIMKLLTTLLVVTLAMVFLWVLVSLAIVDLEEDICMVNVFRFMAT